MPAEVDSPSGPQAGRSFLNPPAPVVFLIVLAVYWISPNCTSGDSRWSIHTASSILREGNADLNEFDAVENFDARHYPNVEKVGNRYYTKYPPGASLAALPFVWLENRILNALLPHFPELERRIRVKLHEPEREIDAVLLYKKSEHLIASFLTALAAMVLFLVLRTATRIGWIPWVATAVFSFGTSAWSTSSRALWQHTPSVLAITLALYALTCFPAQSRKKALAGGFLALSLICRPGNIVSVLALSLYVAIHGRRYRSLYLLLFAAVLVPWIIYNVSAYGSGLPDYYTNPSWAPANNRWEGFLGTLFSPSRGLLVFSPVLIFSFWGMFLGFRDKPGLTLNTCMAGAITAHWISFSMLSYWWAGHSYGPRYFTDILPYFILLLVTALERLAFCGGRVEKVLRLIFIALFAFSVFVHARGALNRDVLEWNVRPANIAHTKERLWDWSDPQFMRGIGVTGGNG